MINQRKAIDALLFLEAMFIRLGSLAVRFTLAIGRGLWSLVSGRRGPSLLSARGMYARNILGIRKVGGFDRIRSGLYIRRVGRLGSARWLVVGQTRKDY
jgi:hypothetical protein